MNRRTYLQSLVAAGALTLSGCQTMPGESNPSETPPDEAPIGKEFSVTDYSFEQISADNAPEDPTLVVLGEHEYRLSGKTSVKNGCMYLTLRDEPTMVDSDSLTVGVTIGSTHNGNDACTQAIVPLGFEVTFTTTTSLDQLQLTLDTVDDSTTIIEPTDG